MKKIYIRWCDATSRYESWSSLEDSLNWANSNFWEIEEIGWLLKETKEYILIAGKVGFENGKEPLYGQVTKIPKTWIKQREEILINLLNKKDD